MLFDQLQSKHFLALLWPERKNDLLYAVGSEAERSPGRLQLARDRHGPLLDDPALPLSGLLARLPGGVGAK
jgi:hypothetical protein